MSGAFACDVNQRALALAAGKPLIMQPAYSRLPLAFLVETVCGPADYAIPATRAAADLAEKLPLPEQGVQKK